MSSLIQNTGQINVNNNFVLNLLDPILPQDGATKHYVDSASSSVSLTSAGSVSLVFNGTGPNLSLFGIQPGTNISLSTTATSLIISSISQAGLVQLNTGTGLSGGPITSSGTLSLVIPVSINLGGTNSNTALNGTSIIISNGSQIVQGQAGTSTTVLHGNAAGVPTYSAVNLSTDVTGVLPVINGGTGHSSFSNGQLLIGSGTTIIPNTLTAGTNIIITNGPGTITLSSNISTFSNGINKQIFSTVGTGVWNIPSGTRTLRCLLIGGGGAGCGAGSNGVGSVQTRGGGGGGAGSVITNYILDVQGSTSLIYGVGTGGAGGPVGQASINFNNSMAGGDSFITLGSLSVTAYGGGGGASDAVASTGRAGGGGGGGGANGDGGPGGQNVAVQPFLAGLAGTGLPLAFPPTNGGIYSAVGGIGGVGGTGGGVSGNFGTVSFYVYGGPGGGSGAGGQNSAGVSGGNGGASYTNLSGGNGGTSNTTFTLGGGGGGGAGWSFGGGAGGNAAANNVTSGSAGGNGVANSGAGGGGGGGSNTATPTNIAVGGNGGSGYVEVEYW